MPAAAPSAAALGSRNSRRQVKAVLALAADAGAYSVGFGVVRGGLSGFTVYFSGDFAGARGAEAARSSMLCASVRVPPSAARAGLNSVATTAPCAAAFGAAPPSSYDEQAHATMQADAPMKAASARRRGCRAGRRRRRVSVSGADICACPAASHVSVSHVGVSAPSASDDPPPPPPPLPSISACLPAAAPQHSPLSALASTFVPCHGGIAGCGPSGPKASRRGGRCERDRERYESDRRYLRDRARDVRDRPHHRPRVHVPLGVTPRTVGGLARCEERRTQLYYHGMRANEYEISDSEVESGEVCSSDG